MTSKIEICQSFETVMTIQNAVGIKRKLAIRYTYKFLNKSQSQTHLQNNISRFFGLYRPQRQLQYNCKTMGKGEIESKT